MNEQNTFNELSRELNELKQRENNLRYDIAVLSTKLDELKGSGLLQAATPQTNSAHETYLPKDTAIEASVSETTEVVYANQVNEPLVVDEVDEPEAVLEPESYYTSPSPATYHQPSPAYQQPPKTSLETYIGGSVISKIGIVILLIGIAIGVKYAVENDLISPVMRVLLGYVAGGILLGFALYLKDKFTNYSAVLLGGGMAVMYFTTYLGYSTYGMFSQIAAFAILFAVTLYTIYNALKFNMQVIAILGMVGAYAVPFLVSDGSGRVAILFSYTAIVNVGILIIAIKKYWKLLFNLAFITTWIIFYAWFTFSYQSEQNTLAFVFSSIFFITFFATFMLNKALYSKPFLLGDHILIIANSLVYYVAFHSLFQKFDSVIDPYALATLCLGLFHLGAAYCVHTIKQVDKSMVNTMLGLAVGFITLSVPLQFAATTTTVIWICEAVLLFVIAHRYKLTDFLYYSLIVLGLTALSLLASWSSFYGVSKDIPSLVLLNEGFLTSILVSVGLVLMSYLFFYEKYNNLPEKKNDFIQKIIALALPLSLFVLVYTAFVLEINLYWTNVRTALSFNPDAYLGYIAYAITSSIVAFTLLYAVVLNFIQKLKSDLEYLPQFTVVINMLSLLGYFIVGFIAIGYLRDYCPSPFVYYLLRYSQLIFAAVLVYYVHLLALQNPKNSSNRKTLDVLVQICILLMISNELVDWLHFAGLESPNKLVLTILWSAYAVGLLAYGIKFKLQHLRYMAMAILGLSILKLFFYDLINLSTLAKTVIFILLGVLLLLASFLYNKFAHEIDK